MLGRMNMQLMSKRIRRQHICQTSGIFIENLSDTNTLTISVTLIMPKENSQVPNVSELCWCVLKTLQVSCYTLKLEGLNFKSCMQFCSRAISTANLIKCNLKFSCNIFECTDRANHKDCIYKIEHIFLPL